MNLKRYRTFVFDCDGVLLNSNTVKTDAFRHAALPYGAEAAEALVSYHQSLGGVSRFKKFAHFLEHLAPRDVEGPDLDALLAAYASAVEDWLMGCEIAPGLSELRDATADARWLVVSGGAQSELRDLFARRGIDRHFDGGIFGSPDTKDVILARELAAGSIVGPALFLGDSRYDHEAAARAGLDFLFVSGWSEFADWRSYLSTHGLPAVERLCDLLEERP